MTDVITTVEQLEACIGAPSLGVKMKVIDHLDTLAARWIEQSPLAFLGAAAEPGPHVSIAGGPIGFASVDGQHTLVIPRSALDDDAIFTVGAGVGALFLTPGVGETLRANGHVAAVTQTAIELHIEESFVHCAKALIRSDFWNAAAVAAPATPAAFIASTRFLAIATMDRAGHIDISPKGDPAGLLLRSDGDRLILGERPGNRLAFGYRNIIDQSAVAAVAIIPGSSRLLRLHGRASLSMDEKLRKPFAIEGKAPKLVTSIAEAELSMTESAALGRAALTIDGEPLVDPVATLVAHVKLNRASGVQAALLRLAVNRGLLEKGLKENYRKELY
jgi:predicted pyridoxine 5'-phosphate oxidase superfamily flavin-nucleotide-binding protein